MEAIIYISVNVLLVWIALSCVMIIHPKIQTLIRSLNKETWSWKKVFKSITFIIIPMLPLVVVVLAVYLIHKLIKKYC